MKYFVATYLAFATFFSLLGQDVKLRPCGTIDHRSEWLKNYQKNPSHFDTRSGAIIWVPISVTIVGNDDGTGYISERTVHESLCTLNEDYTEAEIQFYLAKPIRYINSTAFAQHTTVVQGAQFMFQYNYPDMINNYIMDNAAGNCGYNLPYAGVALASGCTQPQDHTWAHEIGHNLSLPHPFLGWEGGISWDGSQNPNFSNPAPEKVTYNYTYFKDTLILDTLIIDTAYVERVDGSNCTYAADGFCDTKPDYLAARWSCDASNNSVTEQTDPIGEKFYSDGSLFMSYAMDNCSSRFSPEQIAAMRANLIDEKSSYLGNENVLADVVDNPVDIIAPAAGSDQYYQDVYFEWDAVPNATAYTVQLALSPTFGLVVFDTLVYDNFFTIEELKFSDKKHYFRIKALNEYDFCSDFVASSNFQATEESTSVNRLAIEDVSIIPTLVNDANDIRVINPKAHKVNIQVTDVVGKIYHSQVVSSSNSTISTLGWPIGLYFVAIIKGGDVRTVKIAVVN